MNALSAKKWVLNCYNQDLQSITSHFVAISTNHDAVSNFGIKLNHCYDMWDWVGGRYSLWSSIGIAIVFAIGVNNYIDLLRGAYAMDMHFLNADIHQNIPMILGILGVLNGNVLGAQSQVVLPYCNNLSYLPNYLQQADMESNGKSVCLDGNLTNAQTGIALWGGVGTNGQHAFHQLLHQGSVIIPADFIAIRQPNHSFSDHHEALLANCLAQSQAMLKGVTLDEAREGLKEKMPNNIDIDLLAKHKVVAGNKPSNTIIMDKLNPYNLGSLIAMYEHKIFVQGVIWDINSYDQWGVELGKQLASPILDALKNINIKLEYADGSTNGLIEILRKI